MNCPRKQPLSRSLFFAVFISEALKRLKSNSLLFSNRFRFRNYCFSSIVRVTDLKFFASCGVFEEMADELQMSPQLEQIHGEIRDNFRAIENGFQKLEKIKDPNRQSKQLEELTGKMRECKRLIKEFDRESKDEESGNPPEVNKQLNERKQSMIKELNSFVTLRKTYMSSIGNKRVDLFEGGTGIEEPRAEEDVQMASSMSNQELIDAGKKKMDETDQAIERSKMVVESTVEVGAQTGVKLKGQTEQMGRIVNELDTVQFSIKKASQLVKEIGRKVATDKCIMLFLFLIVCGVIAIIVVKIVNPNNKDIRDIPGLAPPTPSRKLLSLSATKLLA